MTAALASFINAYRHTLATAPGGLGGQCVDLANLWLKYNGKALQRLNAADWTTLPQLGGKPFIVNGPTNFPMPGAIVVWRSNVIELGIGPYGHIAVVITADPVEMITLDQDWPTGSGVEVVDHSYVGVAGWFNLL